LALAPHFDLLHLWAAAEKAPETSALLWKESAADPSEPRQVAVWRQTALSSTSDCCPCVEIASTAASVASSVAADVDVACVETVDASGGLVDVEEDTVETASPWHCELAMIEAEVCRLVGCRRDVVEPDSGSNTGLTVEESACRLCGLGNPVAVSAQKQVSLLAECKEP